MANKTQTTELPAEQFLDAVEPEARRADAIALAALMARISGESAAMWGPAIVGFGTYHYRYDSGREGDICRIGFSPRKGKFALYLGDLDGQQELLDRLGRHGRGSGCLYVARLSDIDAAVLEALVRAGFEERG